LNPLWLGPFSSTLLPRVSNQMQEQDAIAKQRVRLLFAIVLRYCVDPAERRERFWSPVQNILLKRREAGRRSRGIIRLTAP
jgi:hypothetical protein